MGEVLKCRVTVREDDVSVTLYDGLMTQMPGQLDYSVTSSRSTTRELIYVITAYLETSVGNAYQEKQLEADFHWWVEAEAEDSPITPVCPNVPDKPLLELPTGVYDVEIEGAAPEGYVLETGLSEDHFELTCEGAELTLHVTVTALPSPETLPATE